MSAKKILFITQEMVPYVDDSAMSLSGRSIPQAVQENGREIRTFMPRWGIINERRNQLHEVIRLSGMNIIIDDTDHPLIIKVASIQSARMQVYFIDNDDYFHHRAMMNDADGSEYEDNAERAIFYARGVLETVKKLRWCPDVIHCHGWMSAIAPLYIRTAYKDELPPRIVVQVKSQDGDIRETTIQSLKGAMREGDYGVFVTLSDYTKNAKRYLSNTPIIRGINGAELAGLVLKYYDGLSAKYRKMIPLEMVYIPVVEEE